MPYDLLLGLAVTRLSVSPSEFWSMTFYEYWALYEIVFGEKEKEKFDKEEYDRLMKGWLNGNS